MVKSSLISLIHKPTVIQRWNDHIRPFTGFTEIDKQAHKTFYAYCLAKCHEEAGGEVDYSMLAEGIIFEYLHRAILTDIKPPVYHQLKKQMEDKINSWVETQLEPHIIGIDDGEFFKRMHRYFFEKDYSKTEKSIIHFSHYLATKWEFDVIYPLNIGMYRIEKTKSEVEKSLADCEWFEGKKTYYQNPGISDFLNLIGQLRFQQRWTATARIPQTSVIGHTLVVAFLSYFFSLEMNHCNKRAENNFFGGLFHDLPEVLTRDIISPVKNGVEGLDEIIKDIEDNQIHKIVYPLIPESFQADIDYFTKDEFSSKIINNGEIVVTSSEEISGKYNDAAYNPIDGKVIRICDHMSAYLEAYLSLENGIASHSLKSSIRTLYENYKNVKIDGVDFGHYFESFNIN